MVFAKFMVKIPVAGAPLSVSANAYNQDELPESFLRNELDDIVEETASDYDFLFSPAFYDEEAGETDEEEAWEDFVEAFTGTYQIITQEEFERIWELGQ